MGYYTSHKLSIIDSIKDNKIADEIFEEIQNDGRFEYIFDWLWDFSESTKWYYLEKDLSDFSKKYPNTIFEVEWKWEESWDIWKMLIRNWKSKKQEAIITIPEININDL